MKQSHQIIIWWAISRYLTADEISAHEVAMKKLAPMGDIKFINYIKRNFEIERLRTQPVVWQDIWIYNYLTINTKSKISRAPLLTSYEKEIMMYSPLLYGFTQKKRK